MSAATATATTSSSTTGGGVAAKPTTSGNAPNASGNVVDTVEATGGADHQPMQVDDQGAGGAAMPHLLPMSLTGSGLFPVGFDLTKSSDALPPLGGTGGVNGTTTSETSSSSSDQTAVPTAVELQLFQRTKGSSWQKIENQDKVRVTAGGKDNKKVAGRILQAHFISQDPRFTTITVDGIMAVDLTKKIVLENLEIIKVIPQSSSAVPTIVEVKLKVLCKRMVICGCIHGLGDARAYIYSNEFEAHNDGNKGKPRTSGKEKDLGLNLYNMTDGCLVASRSAEELEQEVEELMSDDSWNEEERGALQGLVSSNAPMLHLFLRVFRELQTLQNHVKESGGSLSSSQSSQQAAQQNRVQEVRNIADLVLKDAEPLARSYNASCVVVLYWRKEQLPNLHLHVKEDAPNSLFEREVVLNSSSNAVFVRGLLGKNYAISVDLQGATFEQLKNSGAIVFIFDTRKQRRFMIIQNRLQAGIKTLEPFELAQTPAFWRVGIITIKRPKVLWQNRENKLHDEDY